MLEEYAGAAPGETSPLPLCQMYHYPPNAFLSDVSTPEERFPHYRAEQPLGFPSVTWCQGAQVHHPKPGRNLCWEHSTSVSRYSSFHIFCTSATNDPS